jgi:hypothetical protein
MDEIFFARAAERVLVDCGAIFFGYLGYKLYIRGIGARPATIQFKSKLAQFAASGTGPGLVFMGFGAVILTVALLFGGVKESSKTTASSGLQTELDARSSSISSFPSEEKETVTKEELKK